MRLLHNTLGFSSQSLCLYLQCIITLSSLLSLTSGCEDEVKIVSATSQNLDAQIMSETNEVLLCPKSVDGSEEESSGDVSQPAESSPSDVQYVQIEFDRTYVAYSFKVKSKRREVSMKYSRPGDAILYGRDYRDEGGNLNIALNPSMVWYTSYSFPNSMKPPFVMDRLMIQFEDPPISPDDSHCVLISMASGLCNFSAVQSYTIPEPANGDPSYDGEKINGVWNGGLGLLSIPASPQEYVEWERDTHPKVEFTFQFREIQNVTSITVDFAGSLPEFSAAKLTCFELFEKKSDPSQGKSRVKDVSLSEFRNELYLDFVAHSVLCEMTYRDGSEAIRLKSVDFNSRKATKEEIAANDKSIHGGSDSNSDGSDSSDDGSGSDSGDGSSDSGSGSGGSGSSDYSDGSDNGNSNNPFDNPSMQYLTLIIAVIAILCGVMLTFVCIGIGVICFRRRDRQLKKKYESAYSKGEFFPSGLPPEHPYQALSQLDQYETPRYHTNATLDMASRQLPEIPGMMGNGGPGNPPHNHPNHPSHEIDSSSMSGGSLYAGIPPSGGGGGGTKSPLITHSRPVSSSGGCAGDLIGSRVRLPSPGPPLNVLNKEPYYWSLASSRIYTEPDLVSQIREQNTLTRVGAGGNDSLARNVARAYAETDITQIQSGIFGGTFEMSNVLEYPKNNLIYLKDLGKGQFATVHLCVAPGILDGNPETPVKVAVKFLHADAQYEQREAFKKEVKVLSDLRHPNIINLYGVCTRSGPPMMILEYMENGDLYQFLRRHEPDLATYATSSNIHTLSVGTLIHMGKQVAAGMAHVESVNFIHRDLASRNCLVGLSQVVKIGDFGMSRELYSNDYYKIEGKAVLPIRWMAWESIVMGKFSNKSDVWSFGVLMWELFTLAKCQPFSNRSDEQVIENLTNIWENKESETLPQPTNCPDQMFELMLQCWKSSPDARPTFVDILSTLTKLNQDYAGPVAV